MTLDEFLETDDFQRFMDEELRLEAVRGVDALIRKLDKTIKRHQLHAIAGVIQGAGLPGLRDLAKHQKEKNTNKANKAFWGEMQGLLVPGAQQSELSLFQFLQDLLAGRGLLEDEARAETPVAQKQTRRRNRDAVEAVMAAVLGVYFEHFTCHYFYRTQGGA